MSGLKDEKLLEQESPAVADKPARKHAKNCSNWTCLQRCRWQYWSMFIRLAVVASKICEIPIEILW